MVRVELLRELVGRLDSAAGGLHRFADLLSPLGRARSLTGENPRGHFFRSTQQAGGDPAREFREPCLVERGHQRGVTRLRIVHGVETKLAGQLGMLALHPLQGGLVVAPHALVEIGGLGHPLLLAPG